VLQIGEAQRSVLESHRGDSEYTNHGERIVAGQRCMQAAGDIFLGWMRIGRGLDRQECDDYVRQL